MEKLFILQWSDEPVFLVFINDGGCKSGIKKFIVESSAS